MSKFISRSAKNVKKQVLCQNTLWKKLTASFINLFTALNTSTPVGMLYFSLPSSMSSMCSMLSCDSSAFSLQIFNFFPKLSAHVP